MSVSPRVVFFAARPWQWIKNAVVLLPWVFGQKFEDPEATRWSWLVALAFCALSSGTYLLNDVADREGDARDPRRRDRAVAAGRLSVAAAIAAAVVALGIGLTMSIPVARARGMEVLFLGAGYVLLTSTYSFALKRIFGFGAAIVALGFLLRVHAGGVAAGVPVSEWLSLCTFLGAWYVALEKRAADARAERRDPAPIRRLELVAMIAAVAFVVSYATYTVSARTLESFGTPWFSASTLPIAIGVIRFHRVARNAGLAADPALTFLRDAPLIGCVVGYAAIVALVLSHESG